MFCIRLRPLVDNRNEYEVRAGFAVLGILQETYRRPKWEVRVETPEDDHFGFASHVVTGPDRLRCRHEALAQLLEFHDGAAVGYIDTDLYLEVRSKPEGS